MANEEEVPWEGKCMEAAYDFGLKCAELHSSNPYPSEVPLHRIINALMTELWDRGFSQSEIRSAFEEAVAAIPHYAAGEERRS
jgi:hypothetical protein